jgi:hypothetical protein
MLRTVLATAVVLAAMGTASSASAQTNTFTVDCNRGKKVAWALDQGDYRKPVLIKVRGTCREFVTITRDKVTLRGDPAAEIVAPDQGHDLVTVTGDQVTLENLTLTGGLTGLAQEHAPTFHASNVVVQDTSGGGVRVRVGDARLVGCRVQRAGGIGVSVVRGGSVILSNGSEVVDSAGPGISATQHGVLSLTNSKVMRSGAEGIVLGEGSRGNISGSEIKDNRAVGLNVGTSASASVMNTTISGNGTGDGPQGGGIIGYMGANLVLGNLVIEGNGAEGVSCHANCAAQMEEMSIHGNAGAGINLAFDSTLMLFGPIDATGNGAWGLYCHDAESSVNDTGLVTGGVSPTCSGFD